MRKYNPEKLVSCFLSAATIYAFNPYKKFKLQ